MKRRLLTFFGILLGILFWTTCPVFASNYISVQKITTTFPQSKYKINGYTLKKPDGINDFLNTSGYIFNSYSYTGMLVLSLSFNSSGSLSNSGTYSFFDETNNSFPKYAWWCIVKSNTDYIYKAIQSSTSSNTGCTITTPPTGFHHVTIYDKDWIPETCSDGIQNQDETAIDFGGVCGIGGVVYDNFGCTNQSFSDTSTISWYNGLYGGTASLIDPPLFSGSISAYYGTGANYDIVTVYDYPFQTSVIDDRSFSYNSGYESYFDGGNIRTFSVRNGIPQKFNAVAIYGTGSGGYGVFRHSGSDKFTTSSTPFSSSGATYWIDNETLSDAFDGIYQGTITGLRLGKTTSTLTKRSCKNAAYSCEWRQEGQNNFKCVYPYSYELSDEENLSKCAVDNSGSCVPIAFTGFALPGQTTITTASGEIISSAWDPPTSSKISNIFSCDKNKDLETTWQEYLTCISTIIENAVDYFSRAQDETTKTVKDISLTKTGTSNPFDQGQTTNNPLMGALKTKAETQLVGETKTAIFVKIFYWLAIFISISLGLLLYKKEK